MLWKGLDTHYFLLSQVIAATTSCSLTAFLICCLMLSYDTHTHTKTIMGKRTLLCSEDSTIAEDLRSVTKCWHTIFPWSRHSNPNLFFCAKVRDLLSIFVQCYRDTQALYNTDSDSFTVMRHFFSLLAAQLLYISPQPRTSIQSFCTGFSTSNIVLLISSLPLFNILMYSVVTEEVFISLTEGKVLIPYCCRRSRLSSF